MFCMSKLRCFELALLPQALFVFFDQMLFGCKICFVCKNLVFVELALFPEALFCLLDQMREKRSCFFEKSVLIFSQLSPSSACR